MARVARLLILLTLPTPLSEDEADAWLRDAVALLCADRDVEGAEVSSLASGSRRCPRDWDRMVELHLTDGAGASGWADTGVCAEWLAELRSLRLAPVVLLADTVRDTERA